MLSVLAYAGTLIYNYKSFTVERLRLRFGPYSIKKRRKVMTKHENKKSYSIDMLHGALLPKILIFCLPLALSGILQLLFNAADIIVLGRFVGPDALAAVGATSQLINLLLNIFIGLSVGVNVQVARYYAQGRDRDVNQVVETSIATSLVFGTLFIFIGILVSAPVLGLMGTPSEVISMSVLYIRIYFLGFPAIVTYNFGAAILRAIGDTKRPLYFLMAAGVVNVFLNLFFVIVCGLGVSGVAIATTVSNYISAGLVLRTLTREEGALKLELKKLKINKIKFLRIFRIGLPAGLQGGIFSISNVLIQSSVNSFGYIVMAGSTASANLEGFVYNAMNSVYQANLSFTSQNVGAGKYSRINRILLTCQFVVFLIGGIMGGLFYLFGPQLLGIYSNEPDVIAAGMVRMTYITLVYFLCGFMDVFVGSLRGMGYAVVPMIVSLLGACAFRVLWIFTVFAADHTMETLFISYPISWVLTAFVHFICFLKIRAKFPKEDAQDIRARA